MTLKAYKVEETIDEYGKTGGTIGYWALEHDANQAAKGRGYFGGKASVKQVTLVLFGDRFYELAHETPIELGVDIIKRNSDIKETALSKLTDEEKKALGL